MGDCYYHGIGTPVDYEKAASCYQVAAEMERSSLAMWNLGWMHENGIGTVRDFHLAKRWYDSSLHYNREAYLIVKLSLIKLRARYYWNYFFGRDVGRPLSSSDDAQPAEDEKFTSWTAWWSKAIKKKNNDIQRKIMDDNRPDWDIGEEGEHLTRQYDRHRRQNELDEEDGLYEGGSGMDDEEYSEEDELVESLMILGLCVLVGWLVYVRQFRFQNPMPVQPAPAPDDDEDD
jgi:SEL1 protein